MRARPSRNSEEGNHSSTGHGEIRDWKYGNCFFDPSRDRYEPLIPLEIRFELLNVLPLLQRPACLLGGRFDRLEFPVVRWSEVRLSLGPNENQPVGVKG